MARTYFSPKKVRATVEAIRAAGCNVLRVDVAKEGFSVVTDSLGDRENDLDRELTRFKEAHLW
jgi:hypothetical protein